MIILYIIQNMIILLYYYILFLTPAYKLFNQYIFNIKLINIFYFKMLYLPL